MATATPTKPAAAEADPARDSPPAFGPELHQVPVAAIDVGTNVRAQVGDVDELAASIKANGVLSPIRVADVGSGRYELVYGQRRLAAARQAGWEQIPAIVDAKAAPAADRTVAQLLENLQRADLNPLDTATAYRQLLDTGLSQRELAAMLGLAQPTIAGTLRLLKLPAAIQVKVADGELSASHAKAIAALPNDEQAEVARRAVEHKLSAHELEAEVRRATDRATAADRQRDEVRLLADSAEEALGKKKAATKEAARLRVFDAALGAELLKRGWTLVQQTAGYMKPAGCDCAAWEISRNYMGGNQTSVTIKGACVDPAHVAAEAKRSEEARKQANAEYEAKRVAERAAEAEEFEKAVTPLVERLTQEPELRSRIAFWVLTQQGWGPVYDELEEAKAATDWPSIAKLPITDVERWAVRILAGEIIDAPEVLAALAPTRPAKAKKVAR